MELYCITKSPPCRAVFLVAKALGIELNRKYINLQSGEHLEPEFIKINPQHTVPTLIDGDFVLWESRAIMIYLVEKYGQENDSLYPKCPRKRALINQRLYFDMGILYKAFAENYHPQIFKKCSPDPTLFKNLESAMEILDNFLAKSLYATGDSMTLADLALLVSVSTIDVSKFNIKIYKNVMKWYRNMRNMAPGAAEDWVACLELQKYFK
ncbi:glutathione S-transferase 1-like [Haematobia irritans]|uniref:glutathione S-transferase 1-like n=1 Tax=Haematobia irritans TaxID=7368 RepID=UPI003F50CA49